MFDAMRLASSRVSNFAADRRPGSPCRNWHHNRSQKRHRAKSDRC